MTGLSGLRQRLNKMSEAQFSQKEINSAIGVIRRRRTNFEKKVRRKLPLFAEQLIGEYQDQNPLEPLKNREQARFAARMSAKARREVDKQNVKKYRREVRALCADDAEFRRVGRRAIEIYGSTYKERRWLFMRDRLRKRLKPLTELADMVLAWLEQENQIVSYWDLWRSRGDGSFSPKQILDALHELYSRELLLLVGSKYSKSDDGSVVPCAAWQLARSGT